MRASSGRQDCCAIAIMAKASLPGQCKTRLVPPLTVDEAALCNTRFLEDIAAGIARAARRIPIQGCATCHPAGSDAFFRSILPADFELIHPPAVGLFTALTFSAKSLLDAGYGAVCLVNSDSPNLPSDYLVSAVETLRSSSDRVVLGPSDDGGYYLIGMNRWHPRLFEGIDWSTERVVSQTLQRAAEIGVEVDLLETWYDVDDGCALNRLAAELLDSSVGVASSAAVRSAELLVALRLSGRLSASASRTA